MFLGGEDVLFKHSHSLIHSLSRMCFCMCLLLAPTTTWWCISCSRSQCCFFFFFFRSVGFVSMLSTGPTHLIFTLSWRGRFHVAGWSSKELEGHTGSGKSSHFWDCWVAYQGPRHRPGWSPWLKSSSFPPSLSSWSIRPHLSSYLTLQEYHFSFPPFRFLGFSWQPLSFQWDS